jgi:phosphoribosyl-ATP pyrophosphohydrolase
MSHRRNNVFYKSMNLQTLFTMIYDRQKKKPKGSYVSNLLTGSIDRLIQKIGEEATEVVIAAKNKNKKRQVEEFADLLFHMSILLVKLGIDQKEIFKELERRRDKIIKS